MSSSAHSTAYDPKFWCVPLLDQATCIRLLRISSTPALCSDSSEAISCEMVTCELSRAPSYVAISYTWGTPALTRHIVINRQLVAVRENCYFALQHALQKRYKYVWIDALCVDQDDLDEKSYQVTMMGRIYEAAKCVLVSLGQSSSESVFLDKHLSKFEFITEAKDNWEMELESTKSELGSDSIAQLARASIWVANHPYFTRAWIVQEFIVARELIVRCGEATLDLAAIYYTYMNLASRRYYHDASAELGHRLEAELASFPDNQQLLSSPLTVLWTQREEFTRKKMYRSRIVRADLRLSQILDFRANECSNPVDHIYAFTHLMENPRRRKQTIIPDYKTSVHSLAMQCLNELRPGALVWCRQLFAALRMDSRHPDIQALLQDREQSFLRQCERQQFASKADKDVIQVLVTPTEDQQTVAESSGAWASSQEACFERGWSRSEFDESHFVRLKSSQGGQLTGYLVQNRPEFDDIDGFETAAAARAASFANEWSKHLEPQFDHIRPQELFEGDAVVGLLCCRAQSGDYVLQTPDQVLCGGTAFHVCLLIRPYLECVFEVIGQGLVNSDWAFCLGGDECDCRMFDLHCPCNPDRHGYGFDGRRILGFELHLSREDIIAFAAHDLAGGKINTQSFGGAVVDLPLEPRDPWAPLQRLCTNVTAKRFSSFAVSRSHEHLATRSTKQKSSGPEDSLDEDVTSDTDNDPDNAYRLEGRLYRRRGRFTSSSYQPRRYGSHYSDESDESDESDSSRGYDSLGRSRESSSRIRRHRRALAYV